MEDLLVAMRALHIEATAPYTGGVPLTVKVPVS